MVEPCEAFRKPPALDFGVRQQLRNGREFHTPAKVDPPVPGGLGTTEKLRRGWEQPHKPHGHRRSLATLCRSRLPEPVGSCLAQQRTGAGRLGNGAGSCPHAHRPRSAAAVWRVTSSERYVGSWRAAEGAEPLHRASLQPGKHPLLRTRLVVTINYHSICTCWGERWGKSVPRAGNISVALVEGPRVGVLC